MKQTLSVFDPRAAMGIHYLPPSQPIVTLPCPQLPPLLVSGFLGGIVPAFIARRYEKAMLTHSSILAWRISMDREAWRAIVHRVTKNQTQLKQQSTQGYCCTVRVGGNMCGAQWTYLDGA